MLNNLLWAFSEKKYSSKEEFSRDVRQYQIEINGEDTWKPDEIVLDQSHIDILLEIDWEDPPNDKIQFTFNSDNSKNFNALDLMFQLHNFVAQYDLGDHHFFEGFSKNSQNQYVVDLGS